MQEPGRRGLVKNVKAMALPLSCAVSVVLIVAGTLASPPLTGVLYLLALVAGACGAYFLSDESGQNEAATRPGSKRSGYGEMEQPQNPAHADADKETSS